MDENVIVTSLPVYSDLFSDSLENKVRITQILKKNLEKKKENLERKCQGPR